MHRSHAGLSDPVVLSFHAVSPTWTWDFSVTPAKLERIVTSLLRRGYRPATFSESLRAKGKVFAVTFDDGFRSVLEHALPVLTRLRVPGTMFVVTDHAASGGELAWPPLDEWRGGPHERELDSLTWEELRGLAAGGWEIGSHTRSHPELTSLDDAALAGELEGSRAACEAELAGPCEALAYPFGSVDDRVAAAAAGAGYLRAATFPPQFHRGDPLRVPRVAVLHDEGTVGLRVKTSPVVRRVRGSRVWPLVSRARGVARLVRR